jgi:hypothetical protein
MPLNENESEKLLAAHWSITYWSLKRYRHLQLYRALSAAAASSSLSYGGWPASQPPDDKWCETPKALRSQSGRVANGIDDRDDSCETRLRSRPEWREKRALNSPDSFITQSTPKKMGDNRCIMVIAHLLGSALLPSRSITGGCCLHRFPGFHHQSLPGFHRHQENAWPQEQRGQRQPSERQGY